MGELIARREECSQEHTIINPGQGANPHGVSEDRSNILTAVMEPHLNQKEDREV